MNFHKANTKLYQETKNPSCNLFQSIPQNVPLEHTECNYIFEIRAFKEIILVK